MIALRPLGPVAALLRVAPWVCLGAMVVAWVAPSRAAAQRAGSLGEAATTQVIQVETGTLVELHSPWRSDESETPVLEVQEVTARSILLRGMLRVTSGEDESGALEVVRLMPIAHRSKGAAAKSKSSGKTKGGGDGRLGSLDSWTAPAPDHSAFSGKRSLSYRVRASSAGPDAGTIGYVATLTGDVAKISARLSSEGMWSLKVDWAVGEQRVLIPTPDVAPHVGAPLDEAWALSLPMGEPVPDEIKMLVGAVVEAEHSYGSENWQVVARFEPGELHGTRPVRLAALDATSTGASDLGAASAIVRLRARFFVMDGDREVDRSDAGPMMTAIARASDAKDLVALGIRDLGSTDFTQRLAAHALLVELGDETRDALEQLEDEGSASSASAASTVLEAIDMRLHGGGAVSKRRLVSRAIAVARTRFRTREEALAWLGQPPVALLDQDPDRRALGIQRLIDRAEFGMADSPVVPADVPLTSGTLEDQSPSAHVDQSPGAGPERVGVACERAIAWTRALAEVDPDPSVRHLALILAEVAGRPSLPAFDAPSPAWLRPVQADSFASQISVPIAASVADWPDRAAELVWALEVRRELDDLELGMALARVIEALRTGTQFERSSDALFDYDVHTTELALRLIDRARAHDGVDEATATYVPTKRTQLLDAVRALTPSPMLDLAAWRYISDRRIAAPSRAAASIGRIAVDCDAPTVDALRDAIERARTVALEHEIDGLRPGLDILLPRGRYEPPTDDPTFIDIRELDGLRLMPRQPGADGRVTIGLGMRLFASRNVVFEGLEIDAGRAQAVTLLDGSHAVLQDVRVVSGTKALFVSNSTVEIIRSEVLAAPAEGTASALIAQLIGRASLFARGSSFEGGSIYMGQGRGEVWLDRCVLHSGQRPIVQGQRGARLFVRESLLRSEGIGIMSIDDGLIAASVIDADQHPLGRGSTGLRTSPRLLHLEGEGQAAPAGMPLTEEPLPPRTPVGVTGARPR